MKVPWMKAAASYIAFSQHAAGTIVGLYGTNVLNRGQLLC